MANNHYVSKPNRRPKNKRRKDYTRETMLKLRALRALEQNQNLFEFLSAHGVILRAHGSIFPIRRIPADEAVI